MNIVIDLRPLIGGRLSGVEIYTRNLVKNLIRIDRKNKYILWINAFADQEKILADFDGENVVKINTRIPNKILNSMLFFFKKPVLDKLIFRRTSLKTDIFFFPDLRPASLSEKVKTVCVVHDLSFEHYPQFFSRKTRLWHKLLNAKKKLKEVDEIIAVSNSTKKDLIETYKIEPQKIKVIHEGPPNTGVNLNHNSDDNLSRSNNSTAVPQCVFTAENTATVRRKYNLPEKYFFFLSTIEPRKNIVRMINAFHEFKKADTGNIKLVIGGVIRPEIFARQKIKITKDIIFTGFVKEEDKPHLFNLASAFIYPSLYEGFGLPLLEAMQYGTPIITSNTSSMPEVCGDAALFFDPKNTDEIASAMSEILKPETRQILKEKMSHQIKKFNWEKCATETLAVIESIYLALAT
jgi:glycosyltransferase involved in cell wall biosynthesis